MVQKIPEAMHTQLTSMIIINIASCMIYAEKFSPLLTVRQKPLKYKIKAHFHLLEEPLKQKRTYCLQARYFMYNACPIMYTALKIMINHLIL